MADMLVPLYDLRVKSRQAELARVGITIVRGMAADRAAICGFVADNFGAQATGWVAECEAALLRMPGSCFVAVQNHSVIGFCCYDSAARGMLGPLGVAADFRCRGVATQLLYNTLQDMKAAGYAYAVIGWVSSGEFYRKSCGAMPIAGSHPGVYSRLLAKTR